MVQVGLSLNQYQSRRDFYTALDQITQRPPPRDITCTCIIQLGTHVYHSFSNEGHL